MHKLLERQLGRLGLAEEHPPPQNEWRQFLNRIDQAYREADQERYLLERSIEISSKEMVELNQKLDKAHKIAGFGYWQYMKKDDRLLWSKEIYEMSGLDPATYPLTFSTVMKIVHPDDRKKSEEALYFALEEGRQFEVEVRLFNQKTNIYKWFFFKNEEKNSTTDKIVSGVAIDITKRKFTEEEVAALNQKLLVSARMAGMADVSTSMLHNVGNILNSLNISIGLLQESNSKEYYKKLSSALDMLEKHREDLESFISRDPKGKLIPEYLFQLSKAFEQEHEIAGRELENVNKHVQYIKEIIVMQQGLSKLGGVEETVSLSQVANNAIAIVQAELISNNIEIVKEFGDDLVLMDIDKSKLLQILINLIQNAKDAILSNPKERGYQIKVAIEKNIDNRHVTISVQDNGQGISLENLSKLFSFGFTTKKHGHGFGLHSSALAAKELGGTLKAQSPGVGQGSVFSLILPFEAEKAKKRIDLYSDHTL